MPIDPSILAWLLPLISTTILGIFAYRAGARRVESQNVNDDAAALKSYAEANAITTKSLADEQQRRHDLEKRVSDLERTTEKQKVRLILDLYLGEQLRIEGAKIERIGTGPLSKDKLTYKE